MDGIYRTEQSEHVLHDDLLEGERLGPRQLECFSAVAEEGGFTQAAARLNISQTAVTKQVHLLEKSLGTRLVDRSTKPVTLTDAGRYLLPLARKAIDSLDEATREMRSYQQGEAGPLRVGFLRNCDPQLLVETFDPFLRAHPGVLFEPRSASSHARWSTTGCVRIPWLYWCHGKVSLRSRRLYATGILQTCCLMLAIRFRAARDSPSSRATCCALPAAWAARSCTRSRVITATATTWSRGPWSLGWRRAFTCSSRIVRRVLWSRRCADRWGRRCRVARRESAGWARDGRDLRLGYGFLGVPQVQSSLKPDKPQVSELPLSRSHIRVLTKTAVNRNCADRLAARGPPRAII